MFKGQKTVDIAKLRELYKTSACAKQLLDRVASKARTNRVHTVERVIWLSRKSNNEPSPRSEVIDLLKWKLTDCNCGTFKNGRRGQPSRFDWSVRLNELGKAARGEHANLEPYGGQNAPAEAEPSDQELADEEHDGAVQGDTEQSLIPRADRVKLVDRPFLLRHGVWINVPLPEDITASELERLASFVRTQPVGATIA